MWDKKYNKPLINAAVTFISASLFGPVGSILGGLGEDLLGKIFSNSSQVISSILANYSYDYVKESFSKQNTGKNHDIEKAIIVSLSKSIMTVKKHPDFIEFEDDIIRMVKNGINYYRDDLDKIDRFFEYWGKFTNINNLSIEFLDRLFSCLNFRLYDVDVVEIEELEDNLSKIIFMDFDNLREINNFQQFIKKLIPPIFKREFLEAIKADSEHKKARLAIEYELSVETKKIIQNIEKNNAIMSEDISLIREAYDILNNKICEMIPYFNEIINYLIDIKQDVKHLENLVYDKNKDINSSPLASVDSGLSDHNEEETLEVDENKVLPVNIIHDSKKRLKGEVFAIELLKRQIRISYDKYTGRYTVLIDRRDVEEAIVSTYAKTEICKMFVADKRDLLIQLDQEIHQFLLGNTKKDEIVIDLPDLGIPLRWASGGVLSVINLWNKNKLEQWTPFFFRDINPWGWNIALGASERQFDSNQKCIKPIEYELNNPPSFIFREFMEETLILESQPKLNSYCGFKHFYFDENRAAAQQREADFFAQEHIKKRLDEEGLIIKSAEQNDGGFGTDVIKVFDIFDTKIDLVVIDRDGKTHITNNVLITFNLLELGVEIIKVLEYSLDERNYILDGEVLMRRDGTSELTRMPCALISHQALKRTFPKGKYEPRYTDGIQPTFIGNTINKNEIRMYDWDINQRNQRMNSTSNRISLQEKQRYKESFERFGAMLSDKNNIPNYFIPGTAKALSLYFARKGNK